MLSCSARPLVLSIVILLTAAASNLPAQTAGGPDVLAEGGLAAGGGFSGASTSQANGFGGVSVLSAPLRMGRNWDFGVGARLAREPVTGMATIDGAIVPSYFDGLRASVSLRFVHTSGPFDVAIVGRYAETRIDRSQRFTPASNDNGLWTFLFEAAAHLRWYGSQDAVRPGASPRLLPLVDVYGGVKHDRRYHRTGDLEPYDDPTGRALGGAYVAAWRSNRGGRPVLTIGGAADFETALRTGVRLPSIGRIMLRADADVRTLFSRTR